MLCPYISKLLQSIKACLSQGSLIDAAGFAITHIHIHLTFTVQHDSELTLSRDSGVMPKSSIGTGTAL